MLHIPFVHAHDVSKQIPRAKKISNGWKCYKTIGSYVSCTFIEIGSSGRKGHSILVVTINRVSQFSLVPTLNSVSDDWSYLHSLWKPGDPHTPPPSTRKTYLLLTPLFPSEKWWPFPYFCSAFFREYKINVLMPFLIKGKFLNLRLKDAMDPTNIS